MPEKLTESDVFVLLAKQRRRLLLRILQESTTPLGTKEIAERIGERESENPSVEEQQSIYVSLYHNHLPRLEEADVVVHDENAGTVAPDLNFDSLIRNLEAADERALSWSSE